MTGRSSNGVQSLTMMPAPAGIDLLARSWLTQRIRYVAEQQYQKCGVLSGGLRSAVWSGRQSASATSGRSNNRSAVRAKKTELLRAVLVISPEHPLAGRYGGGVPGQKVSAYRHEPNVAVGPGTETYVALKLDINHDCPHTAIRP
jgi:hypothetical protein